MSPVSERREEYVKGNLFNIGDSVILRDTNELCRVTYLGSNYVIVESAGKQYRKWLDDIELHEKERKYTAAKMENNIETKAEEENGTKNYDANSHANCATQTVDRLGRAAQSIG